MLYWLFSVLQEHVSGLRVFDYLTFRTIVSALTGFFVVLLSCPYFIVRLKQLQIGQMVRDDGPQTHLIKAGTPTMGGVLIIVAIVISVALWGDWSSKPLVVAVLVTVGFSLIGLVDDYRKVVFRNSRGLPARWKYFWQSVLALVVGAYLYYTAQSPVETQLLIPFLKDVAPQMGFFFIFFTYFVIVGSSNAVNLTDGLDGLALMPTVLIALALGVFAYVVGNVHYSSYLNMPYIANTGELLVFCGALCGAGLGFLWFNAYPAEIFMGDVGALGLGAALGVLAVEVHQELVLLLMGGIFVAETVSVILQVASFKLTGKRIFRMAPLHHHFELKGWSEPKVIVRFWIITVLLVLLGLATLKLR